MEIINTIGRRKTSVARVYMDAGKGEITVNSKPLDKFFPAKVHQLIVQQPLEVVEDNGFNFNVNVSGGGMKGQAEAIRLGIARALVEANEDNRPPLKAEGFLTRDSRMVERKKYGRRKARRRFQFSKR
jgi:small subunit ribosomal protein S9